MEESIKGIEKKIRRLFLARIAMWVVCAAGCIYWIVWSFELYNEGLGDFDAHVYATAFRPHFNIGISISIISITISLILRFISDKHKRELKELLYKVR